MHYLKTVYNIIISLKAKLQNGQDCITFFMTYEFLSWPWPWLTLIRCSEYLLDTVDSMKFLIPGLSNFTTDTELIVEALLPQLDFLMVYITHCTKQLLNHKVFP